VTVPDFSTYSNVDLETLRVQIRAEQEARARAAASQTQADALVEAIMSGRAPDPIVVTRPDGSTYSVSIKSASGADGPGEWEAGEDYSTGAEVTCSGRRYKALKNTTGTTRPPDAPSVWQGL